jgi:hypothetical protein
LAAFHRFDQCGDRALGLIPPHSDPGLLQFSQDLSAD